jgi:lipopolysaccharide/colanic/teichoic acid biosynthesis glycosyltransferase
MKKKHIYARYLKRPMDFVLALIAFIVLSPLMLIFAILVRIKLGSPILFKQERPGKNEKIFRLYKFRTMTNATDEHGVLLEDSLRLTRFGKFLRSTSVDELPGLFNIIKGDMSIVGPRPLLVQYLPLYDKVQKRRHEVSPGLTGWAQVNGRNLIDWKEKLDLDVFYVDNLKFSLDIKIIFITLKIVLKRSGINSKTSVTMDEFTGNNENEG